MQDMWDERFSATEYAYGEAPNVFLASQLERLAGHHKVLLLAEGEGRNAVFLARHGFAVTAVDFSAAGQAKCARLAEKYGVDVEFHLADLNDYVFPADTYDAVISIFGHLPPPIRQRVHSQIPHTLKAGGLCIMKGYTPEQLAYGTGGPPNAAMMWTAEMFATELAALETELCETVTMHIEEGVHHVGMSALIHYIGRLTTISAPGIK